MRNDETTPAGPIDRARGLARLFDAAVRIPGTNIRFGLDAVIGLVPGLGDVAGAGLASYTVLLAARLGAPPSVVLRMVGNVALDTLLGAVPLLGDLFDVGFKANLRNVALLERYVERPERTRRASRGLVLLAVAVLVLLAIGAVWVAGTVIGMLVRGGRG